MYQHPAFRYYVSIHRPHTRPDVIVYGCRYVLGCRFNSQASYEARHNSLYLDNHPYQVSIHRPHTRPDSLSVVTSSVLTLFQFTGLIRGPTLFQSDTAAKAGVSIHRPHTRPDASGCYAKPQRSRFQFTGLIRGPTGTSSSITVNQFHFNSQASYEARHEKARKMAGDLLISIHRPHTRPDVSAWPLKLSVAPFQFTGLIRGPTLHCRYSTTRVIISIHRPHTRPDLVKLFPQRWRQHFNSQASYEARRLCSFHFGV